MPTPIVERAVAAFVAALETALDDIEVERDRDQEIAKFPFVLVTEGDKSVDEDQLSYVRHFQTVAVEGFVQADAPAEIGPARNALYARVAQAALADLSLGGLAVDIREGTTTKDKTQNEAGKPVGSFLTDFTIELAIAHGDPYSLAPA